MNKDNDDILKKVQNTNFAYYNLGFRYGYLAAMLGVNWPDIPENERKPYEDKAREALKLLNKVDGEKKVKLK